MKLRDFRAKEFAKLFEIKKELLEKYPEKADRIKFLCDTVASKLTKLRVYTLGDFMATLSSVVNEFKEFEALIPSTELIEELLKGERRGRKT